MLVLLSGVSGAGKDTIKKEIMKRLDYVVSLPSVTDRAPRDGEVQGDPYDFVTTEEIGEVGLVTIENLYAYEESKGLEQTYRLEETLAPEGYAKLKDVEFRVNKNEDGTFSLETLKGTIENTEVEGNNITITLADSPSFKLTKTDAETGDV